MVLQKIWLIMCSELKVSIVILLPNLPDSVDKNELSAAEDEGDDDVLVFSMEFKSSKIS
jgi:hypothetical protein